MEIVELKSRNERYEFTADKTMSVQGLIRFVERVKENCDRNHKDYGEVPVFMKVSDKVYPILMTSYGVKGDVGHYAELDTWHSNEFTQVAVDARPDDGNTTSEYWESRGPSTFDCSGFVRSKRAGERIMNMVRLALDKEDTKTWLDYRDFEPTWIQLKFSADEFDVEKLHEKSQINDGIINLDMLMECAKREK